ncbi:diguanylate cyclase [Neobacillus sp. LXY-4]|uniref:diguanylate cyclase n=1 Tax=Neobacillus sp. LXY-4 TaxID=3379826 RepID=UPI003EE40018
MFRDLVVNLSFIITFLFIAGQLFREKPIYFSLANKIKAGVLAGILGITLMIFSIQLTDTLIVDLRHLAVILITLYGGIISSIIAGTIIILGRLLIFDIHVTSIAASFLIFSMVIVCNLILKIKIVTSQKMLYMNLSNILLTSFMFSLLLEDQQILIKIILVYGTISLFGGAIIYYISDYIIKSNENYRLLKESSVKDFLTGLHNVRHFDTSWNQHVINAVEKKEYLSLLIIDIDHFKQVNDTYGHPAGDMVLKELGEVLIRSTRSFDTVSRNGGEEFSVILPDCPSHQAKEVAERIRIAVEKHHFEISHLTKTNITVSIGVVTYPETVQETDLIIWQADQNLYKAKNSGRNKVCC